MFDLLRSKNRGLTSELIDFTQALIRTPSPSLSEQRVASAVRSEMIRLGYDRVFTDDSGNVIGVIHGRQAAPTALLVSHLDTISPVDAAWTASPFAALLDHNRITGLGAADCKGGVAAQVYAGALLKRSLVPLDGTIVVAAVVAEENGRSVGLRALIEDTLPAWELTPTYAILGEPTNLGLYVGHDGWAKIDLLVNGPNEPSVHRVLQTLADDFASTAPARMPGQERIRIGKPTLPRGRSHVGRLQLTRWLNDAEQLDDVVRQVHHEAKLLTANDADVDVEVRVPGARQELYTGRSVTVRDTMPPWKSSVSESLQDRALQALHGAGTQTSLGRFRFDSMGMGTAGGALTSSFGIPTVSYGPGDEAQAHKPNESVAVASLSEAVFGTAVLAHELVGVQVFGWPDDEI